MLDYIYQCQTFAQVELGLSVADFDALTPALFDKYVEMWENKQEREEYYQSIIPYMLYNINRGKGPKREYYEFMPRFGHKRVNKSAATTFEEFNKKLENGQ